MRNPMTSKKKPGPKAKRGPKPKKKPVGRPPKAKKVVISDEMAVQLGADAINIDEKKLLDIALKLENGDAVKGFCLGPKKDAVHNRFLECLMDYTDRFGREWKLCVNKADK
jgi:hypothetical protein